MTGNIKTNGNNIDFGGTGKAKNVYELTGERITLTSSDDETIQPLKVRNDRIDFLKDTDYTTDDDGSTMARSAAHITSNVANFEVPVDMQSDVNIEGVLDVKTISNSNVTINGTTTIGNKLIVYGNNDFIALINNNSESNDAYINTYIGGTNVGGICWSNSNDSYIRFTSLDSNSLRLRIDANGNAYISTTKSFQITVNKEQRFYADDAMTKIRNANAKNITLDDDKGIYVCGDILLFENAENCDHLPEDVTEDETTYLDNYLQNIIIDLKRRIEVLEGAETTE